MNFKALALTALAAGTVGFAAPAQAGTYEPNLVCSVWDSGDTYSNFRHQPAGNVVNSLGNGTYLGRPNAEAKDWKGRSWTLFNGKGWIISNNLACDVLS
jgi:hypothetical protein